MNTPYTKQFLLNIALVALTTSAFAAKLEPTSEPPPSNIPCHLLMTEQECSQFKTTVAQLSPGPALERYLSEHIANMLERETACTCNQKVGSGTTNRQRKQALLRF